MMYRIFKGEQKGCSLFVRFVIRLRMAMSGQAKAATVERTVLGGTEIPRVGVRMWKCASTGWAETSVGMWASGLMALLVMFVPVAGAQSVLEGSITGEHGYPYRLYVPEGTSAENPLPLVMFLAGLGAGGTNNTSQVTGEGFSGIRNATRGGMPHAAIVVAPQSPNGWWNGEMVNTLAQHIVSNYPVDTSRQYVLGHSAGGQGTYHTVSYEPSRWAAAVPVCAVSSSVWDEDYQKMADVPIWLIHGNADTTVGYGHSTTASNLLKKYGGTPRYTIVNGGGHGIFHQVYQDLPGYTGHYTGGDPLVTVTGLYNWLWSHSTPRPAELESGQVIRVDFGGIPAPVETHPYDAGNNRWNFVGIEEPEVEGMYFSLWADNGIKTKVDLRVLTPFAGMDVTGFHEDCAAPGWAIEDSWWVGVNGSRSAARNHSGDIVFRDLPRNTNFIVNLLGSRLPASTEDPIVRYVVNAVYQDHRTDLDEPAFCVFENISTGDHGTLQISVRVSADGDAEIADLSVIEIHHMGSHEPLDTITEVSAGDDLLLVYPQKNMLLEGTGSVAGDADQWFNWRQSAGPALAVFDDFHDPRSEVNFPLAGIYEFELTLSDGQSMKQDTVSIRVMDKPLVAITPGNPQQGLKVCLYSGQFSQLPDFTALTAEWEKTVPSVQLSGVHTGDHFALVYEGYIYVPQMGEHRFYLKSDEGSRLIVDDNYLLIDNDGLHRASEKSAYIDLDEGYHQIRVDYFEATGSETLELSWAGPGFSRQVIPEQAYYFSESWGDFEPDADGFIDTGSWMGWIVSPEDQMKWMYSVELSEWFYVPYPPDREGGWIYIF